MVLLRPSSRGQGLSFVSAYLRLFMWTVFKAFVEFVTALLLFYVVVFDGGPCGILAPDQGLNPTALP